MTTTRLNTAESIGERRKFLLGAGLAFALAALTPGSLAAQDFPNKPVRLLVGFAAGGPSDLLARIVAQKLSDHWKQPVVVENRVGAAGTVAAAVVARAAPDGYTLAFAGSTTFIGYELLNPSKVPYKTLEAFEPVCLVADQTMVMSTRTDLGVKTVQEFVAMAKSKPGAMNFGMSGFGSPPHLNMELFKQGAGIDLLTVPFAGSAPSAQALLSGTIDAMMDGPQGSINIAKDGKTRIIAVADDKRLAELPDVPTFKELGYDAQVKSWYALLAPKGTPRAVIDKIDADARQVLGDEAVLEMITRSGFKRNLLDSKDFGTMLREQTAKVAALIKSANIKAE